MRYVNSYVYLSNIKVTCFAELSIKTFAALVNGAKLVVWEQTQLTSSKERHRAKKEENLQKMCFATRNNTRSTQACSRKKKKKIVYI